MEDYLIDFLKNNFFNVGWLNKEKLIKERYIYFQDIELILAKAGATITEFYTFLLLSGEYSKLDIEDFKKSTNNVTNYLFTESSGIVFDTNEEEEIAILSDLQALFKDYTFDVLDNIIIPNFYSLLKDVKIQYTFDKKYKLNSKNNFHIPEYSEPAFQSHLKVFLSAIKITRIEHFEFKYNRETVQLLHSILNDINSIKNSIESEITNALWVKVNFIFKKFLYRNESEIKLDRYTQFISDLQSDEEFSTENFKTHDGFQKWEERLKYHYELTPTWKDRIKSYEKKWHQSANKKYSFENFHTFTKNYKDISKSNERLENLHEEFIKKYSSKNFDQFWTYSYSVSNSYIFNNILSISLENISNYSIDTIKLWIKKIEDHQKAIHIENFFPWYKLSLIVSQEIDTLSKILFKSEKYSEFDENLKLFTKILTKFEECFEWSLNKNYLPYQLPFDECFSEYSFKFKITNKAHQLFFFTSYILPSNYSFYNSEFEKIKNIKIKSEALGEVYKSIQIVVDEVKDNSQKVNDAERRSIETLAIFSAVALFSIGSIQIFSFESVALDPLVFYNFVLSFGYSLAIFVLLIWMITRQTNKRLGLYHIGVLILLIIASFFVVNNFVSKLNNSPNIETPRDK